MTHVRGSGKQRMGRAEAGIGLIVGSAVALLLFLSWPVELQRHLTDGLYGVCAAGAGNRVAIVAVDDASLGELGRWEDWPRRYHASLIDALAASGARVIALDLLFAEESPDDPVLEASIRRAGNVVMPVVGQLSVSRRTIAGDLVSFDNFLRPTPRLAGAAAALGHVNSHPEADSLVRRIPAAEKSAATGEVALSIALAAVTRFLRLPAMDVTPRHNRLALAGRDIPLDDFGLMLVPYAGPPSRPGAPGTFPVYSYADVLKGRVPPDAFRGRLVLVGVMASGLLDSYPTPMAGEKMHGVEILANVADSVLAGRFLQEQPLALQIVAVYLLALAGAFAFAWLGPARAGAVASIALVGYWFAVVVAFRHGLILNVLHPSLTIALVYLAVVIHSYGAEARRRRLVTDLFGRYLSPDVAAAILDGVRAGSLQLGGTRREVSVLFADIRGFTALTENRPPEEVVAILNGCLARLVEVAQRFEGTVNKFLGDCIMVVWNAPLDQPDHPCRAFAAACEMQRVMGRMAEGEGSQAVVEIGVGVSSGLVVAGNIGSRTRAEYTVIGEAANLASRLCEHAGRGEIMLGPGLYGCLGPECTELPHEEATFIGDKGVLLAYRIRQEALLRSGRTGPVRPKPEPRTPGIV